jgi:hypothetical protein
VSERFRCANIDVTPTRPHRKKLVNIGGSASVSTKLRRRSTLTELFAGVAVTGKTNSGQSASTNGVVKHASPDDAQTAHFEAFKRNLLSLRRSFSVGKKRTLSTDKTRVSTVTESRKTRTNYTCVHAKESRVCEWV